MLRRSYHAFLIYILKVRVCPHTTVVGLSSVPFTSGTSMTFTYTLGLPWVLERSILVFGYPDRF